MQLLTMDTCCHALSQCVKHISTWSTSEQAAAGSFTGDNLTTVPICMIVELVIDTLWGTAIALAAYSRAAGEQQSNIG